MEEEGRADGLRQQRTSISHVTSYCPHSSLPGPLPPNRTSLSEPDTPQEEKTPNLLHPPPDCRTRETVPQTKVLGLGGTSLPRQGSQDDRCSGQNMVSKSEDKMEVGLLFISALWFWATFEMKLILRALESALFYYSVFLHYLIAE